SIDKAGSGYQLRATDGALTLADSSTFNVATGAVSAAASTVSASPTAVPADGTTTSTITVTLLDAGGNPVAGKTVTLAHGAGNSTISAASGPSNAGGLVTFTVTDTTSENVTYTATDSTDATALSQTAQVALSSIDAGNSRVSASPSSVVADGSTTSTITVTVKICDVNGNVETGDNSTVVTFAKTAGGGTVTGLGTATASGGVASLAVTGQTVGAITITASKTGLTSDTSSFSVALGPADHLTFTSATTSVASSSTKTLTVELRDADGNLETGDNTTVVAFAKTAGAGSVTGLGSATASGGVASLTVTGQTVGVVAVTASKTGLTSDTSSFSVTVGPADHLTYTSNTS